MKLGVPFLVVAAVLAAGPLDARAVAQLRPDSRVADQPESPVVVTQYRATYQKGSDKAPSGVRHDVEFRNRSEFRIVAVQLGLVSFDVWNEFLNRTVALVTEPVAVRARERTTWFAPLDAAFTLQTGVAYVDRVRFDNGQIWIADPEAVVTVMRGIQKDFDPLHLAPRKPGGH
jgi:hypothetical protein